MTQKAAFASGVPPDIYAFHRSTGNSAFLNHLKLCSFENHSMVEPWAFIFDLHCHLHTLYAQ